jgi:hypothetical protein
MRRGRLPSRLAPLYYGDWDMLHPVGELAPSVYWKRRVFLLAAVVLVLVTIAVLVARAGGGDKPKSGAAFTPAGQSTPPATDVQRTPTSSTARSTTAASSSSAAAPKACIASQLSIAAATGTKNYPAGAKPTVSIVVTNKGPTPCVQDLSDSQIELRVYNGSARVWGSHDCALQPGTAPATLPVGQPIRRDVQWSGLSSQPACAGTRTRVGAGTYTLFAILSGQQGKTTATFVLAG